MDEHEKLIVRQKCDSLIRECKSAIDSDDFQRVFKGQVTDSDIRRELEDILVKKAKIKDGDVFQALLCALKKTKHEDLVERLIKDKSTKSSLANRKPAVNSQTIPSTSRNSGGFCFTPGAASSVSGPVNKSRKVEGMDSAGCISNNTTKEKNSLKKHKKEKRKGKKKRKPFDERIETVTQLQEELGPKNNANEENNSLKKHKKEKRKGKKKRKPFDERIETVTQLQEELGPKNNADEEKNSLKKHKKEKRKGKKKRKPFDERIETVTQLQEELGPKNNANGEKNSLKKHKKEKRKPVDDRFETVTQSQEELDAKNKADEELLEAHNLVLRNYQKELAESSLKGKNCIIVAPTGSGKTHVALKIIQNHFLSQERVKKVVFLVNNVAIATQQFKACRRYLQYKRVRLLSGDSTEQLELGLLMPRYDIFVMTAQILVDAIREERDVNFMVAFTLMIFDECHHADNNHPYNKIMFTYMDKKLSEENCMVLPQVVGLTASVGVGKAKGVSQATEHIKKLCANLDAEQICTVQKCVGQLRQFVSVPEEETIKVEGRRADPFRDMLRDQMTLIEKMIKEKRAAAMREGLGLGALVDAPPNKGAQEYSQLISQTRKNMTRRNIYFNSCLEFVEKYNNALIINSDVRTRDALQYLIDEFNKRDSTRHDVDIQLKKWFTDKRQAFESICNDPKYMNSKLMVLEKMILKAYKEKPDSRGIIFVKTKDLVAAICCWMKESPSLKSLNPHKLTGQSSEESGGMTQNQQVDVLKFFEDGKQKIIIATTAAEEGLDIQKCNLVIRYDYVTNVVSMIQARGRGRAEDSEYKALTTKGQGTAERELNIMQQVMMKDAIKILQSSIESDPDTYLQQIFHLQRDAKLQRNLLASQTNHRVFQEVVTLN